MILKKFVSGALKTNTLLIGCLHKKKAVVIDPALSGEEVLSSLVKLDLQLEYIFLSHGHFDHISHVSLLQKTTKAKVCIQADDAPFISDPTSQGIFSFLQKIEPAIPDHLFKDNEIFFIGDIPIEVLFTPGHTLGSVCFWMEKEKLLLSGDTLFKRAMGRVKFKEKMLESLKKLSLLDPETRVIPGHGPETTIGQEKWLQSPERLL
jgi:hydroxyacylglutathione hydrolase